MNQAPVYQVRDLINMDKESIWGLEDQNLEIVFEDSSTLMASGRSTIFSWYGWQFFRIQSGFQVTSDYHFGSAMMTKGNELDFLGRCMKAVTGEIRRTRGLNIGELEEFWKLVYVIQNQIYNDMTTRISSYVTTLSALDILEVMDHPEIAEANARKVPTEEGLQQNHAAIRRVLMRKDDLVTNRLARQVRLGGTDVKQALQVVGQIGYRTEVDSGIFPVPILTSFSQGLKQAYYLGIESRSATKAQYFTKSPLADTQYYNREMQLMTCAMMHLHHDTDCGSKITVPYHVTSSSLKALAGKYHVLEDGSLELITAKSTHLNGKVVQLRSVYGCQHPDPSGVCGTCLGELQYSMASGTNLGHACVVELCEKISQLVLSVKHVDSSSSAERVVIDRAAESYIEVGTNPNEIKLRTHLRNKKVKLRFPRYCAPGLAMLGRTPWEVLKVDDITAMPDVYVVLSTSVGESATPISVSMGSRHGSFTLDFLKFLHVQGVVVSDDNADFYEVDLAGWDYSKEVWELPMRHRNMIEFKGETEEFIKCGGKNAKKGHKSYHDRLGVPVTPELFGSVLRDFHELVSSKLFINIAHLEVTLYATTVRDRAGRDYRLPKGGMPSYFATYNELMANRSLTSAMAYESQQRRFISIDSFSPEGRPPVPLDPILSGDYVLDREVVPD